MDIDILDILRCPDCIGSLSQDKEGMLCGKCARRYPVLGGIYSMMSSKSEDHRGAEDPAYQKFLKFYPEILTNYFYKRGLMGFLHEMPRKVVQSYLKNSRRDGFSLGLGCGIGSQFPYCGESLQNMIGVDIDMDSLKVARDKYPDVCLVHADCHHLPFKSEAFDNIVSMYSMEHFVKLHHALKEADRVLADDGRIFTAIPCEELPFTGLIRRYTSHRYIHKKYGIDWSKVMEMDHCNKSLDIVEAMKEVFDIIKMIYFPFFIINSARVNFVMIISAQKRKYHSTTNI